MTHRSSHWPAAALLLAAAAPTVFAQDAAPPPPAPAQTAPTPPPVPTAPPTPPTRSGPPPIPAGPPMFRPRPSAPFKAPKLPVGPAGVAAVVNGQPITLAQVAHIALQNAGSHSLQTVIINTLILQQAKAQHVTASPAEIQDQVSQIKKRFGRSPSDFESFVFYNNISQADVRGIARVQVLLEKLAAANLPAPHLLHIRHLLVATTNPRNDPNMKPHTDEEAKAIIAKAQADLKAGKPFTEVANTYTEDPSGKGNGGELGILGDQMRYQFDPAFIDAALKLKPGQVSEPVKSQFGYHLIYAESDYATATGAEKARYEPQVKEQQQQAVGIYLQKLQNTAKVTYYVYPKPPAGR